MEGEDTGTKGEALKSQIAIRCMRANFLISSLKSLQAYRNASTRDDGEEEDKRDRLLRTITNLKIELAREREMNRQIRIFSSVEAFFCILVLLSLWSFCLTFAFGSE
ncbi:PREDICTED: uncharacterized protein LOC104605024 [Nelumbo nucifera]|uniref:Uncharacterized protein n=2 Tax=Nelumbo nucifera TaxID=4432 RepID=A0A822ZHH5_NELNU|nr:PREDICTED: uncharacterized protein LOC104605024 [Nelumbo nucifera]DAD41138.1 TPA_asm: hypothetical protein HUJ06_015461 [Nelumbo nucifera]